MKGGCSSCEAVLCSRNRTGFCRACYLTRAYWTAAQNRARLSERCAERNRRGASIRRPGRVPAWCAPVYRGLNQVLMAKGLTLAERQQLIADQHMADRARGGAA